MNDQGWTIEPADRSVGIMSESVYHEDCKLEPVDASGQPRDIEVKEEDTKDGLLYTCECGSTFLIEDEPDIDDFPYPDDLADWWDK